MYDHEAYYEPSFCEGQKVRYRTSLGWVRSGTILEKFSYEDGFEHFRIEREDGEIDNIRKYQIIS